MTRTRQSSLGTFLRGTSSTYTLSGKPATSTDANGNATTYAYDLLDRRTQVTDAVGRITTVTYDAQSRPYQVFNPLVTGAIPGGALASQSYTANGLRASLTDAGNHTTAFAYDGLDRLATTTYPDTSTETLAYDADSNVTSRVTRAGATLLYGYDTLNRLITKTAAAAPVACTAAPSSMPTVTYSYDLAGRLTGVCDNGAPIAAIATPASSTFYTASYSYDAVNRPTGVTYGDVPAATPSPLVPVTFSHGYNAVNRLTLASATGMTAAYAYDARGRRKAKTVNGTTTVFVTDADNREVLEYDGSTGTVLRWYAYGLGPNDVLAETLPGATPARVTFIPDLQGSIVGSVSMTGAVISVAYQPYGGSASPPSQFAYTGQRIDPETTYYYYRARQYSVAWGRFLQVDPVGYGSGANLYAYVLNDPLNSVDSSGMASSGVRSVTSILAATAVSGIGAASDVGVAMSAGLTVTLVLPLALSGDTQADTSGRIYVTYTRTNISTGQVYSGRSSGVGDPLAIVQERGLGQPILNAEGFSPPVLDVAAAGTNSYEAIRGREQQLINFYGGAQSVGGSARNMINGIWDFNPSAAGMINLSIATFGALPDNSPTRRRFY